MPRMIPYVLDSKTPASERRIFELLKSLPGSDDWVVLHSLGLSNAYTGDYGEIDFLILIPDLGILCLEVKGGGVSWPSLRRHCAARPSPNRYFLYLIAVSHAIYVANFGYQEIQPLSGPCANSRNPATPLIIKIVPR